MNFEKTSMGRVSRRAALGTTMAMVAAGAIAIPAYAAPVVTVSSSPQSGSPFTVTATGLPAGSYRAILTTTTTETTNQAESGTCLTAIAVAADATLSCTLTDSSAGSYFVKVVENASSALQGSAVPVTIAGTTADPAAPTAQDDAGSADTVTVKKQAGIVWKVDGVEVTFAAADVDKKMDVTDGAAVVTATAASGYSLPADKQSSWSFKFSTTSGTLTEVAAPAAPTWKDEAGASADTVTVAKIAGVDWYVNGEKVTYTGSETSATVYSTQGAKTTVEARAADGYKFAGNIASLPYVVKLTGEYNEPAVTRLSGANRMDTAVAISKKYWDSASTVYVANGLRFADALTAGPAAAKDGGPLLLVTQDSVPSNVLDELKRLKPSRIHVIGGTSVVSAGVEQALADVAPVTRLAGDTRYATAGAVATRWADNSAPVVYVALGENFPDALSGGSGAAIEDGLLLLSPKSALSTAAVDTIKRVKASKVVLVGGNNVLADAVKMQAEDLVGASKVFRYAGADRYATSAEVAEKSGTATATDKVFFLATGLNFPDALAGVPAADKLGAALFLSQPTCVPPSVKTVINKITGATEQVRLGSEGVLGTFSLTKTCAS